MFAPHPSLGPREKVLFALIKFKKSITSLTLVRGFPQFPLWSALMKHASFRLCLRKKHLCCSFHYPRVSDDDQKFIYVFIESHQSFLGVICNFWWVLDYTLIYFILIFGKKNLPEITESWHFFKIILCLSWLFMWVKYWKAPGAASGHHLKSLHCLPITPAAKLVNIAMLRYLPSLIEGKAQSSNSKTVEAKS